MMYQDEFAEVDCPECRGAGFFGNGPVSEACGLCGGTGVLITDEPLASIEGTQAAPLGPGTAVRAGGEEQEAA